MLKVRASQVFTNGVDEAVEAKKKLDEGIPFTEVVSQFSICPSKENGGDLGWMPEEGAQALMGEISEDDKGKILGPIHSPYGYHIIQITDIELEEAPISFHADTPMNEINKALPEVHTLLFKNFHIGMPLNGYKPEETVFTLCEQHSKPLGEVLALLNKEMGSKGVEGIAPEAVKAKLQSGDPNLALLDIREQWERDICNIEEAIDITQENCESILANLDKNKEIVLVDWNGDRGPSFQKWLADKGFEDVKILEGGIDAWAQTVDTRLNRYDIDDEDDDYKYEDILDDLK